MVMVGIIGALLALLVVIVRGLRWHHSERRAGRGWEAPLVRQQGTPDHARGLKGCRIDPVRVSPDGKPRNNPARSWLHKER